MQFWLDPLAASIKKSSAVSMRVGAETMRCGQSLIVWVRAQPMARRDAALAVGFTVLAFTPGLAEQGTALGWVTPQRSFDV